MSSTLARALPRSPLHPGRLAACLAVLLLLLAFAPSAAFGATKAQQDAWFATAAGRWMNPDGVYGYQCVDVADDYCLALWGNWYNTLGVGNANVLFDTASPTYFTKIRRDASNPNLVPQHGDIVVWGGTSANRAGHVAVVDNASASGMNVYEQNYSSDGIDGNDPCARRWEKYYNSYSGSVIGWLRPKLDPPTFKAYAKQAFSSEENVVIKWDAWPGAVRYHASVWKYPYGDQDLVFDQDVTGTSKDVGRLPVGQYRLKVTAYFSNGSGKVSAPIDFRVAVPPKVTSAGFTNPIAYDLKSLLSTHFVFTADKPNVTAKLTLKTSGGDIALLNRAVPNAAGTAYWLPVWDGKVSGKRLSSASYTWVLGVTSGGVTTTKTGKVTISKVLFTLNGTSAGGVTRRHAAYMVPGAANCYVTAWTDAPSDTLTLKLTGPYGFAPASRYWALTRGSVLKTTTYFRDSSALKSRGTHTFSVTGKADATYAITVIQ